MKEILKALLVGCLFFTIILGLVPIEKPFQFDPDEGINLIKAVLYNKGFDLYTEIWNDQPPLFTVFLSIWIDIWGQSIVVARSLTLVFAAIIVASLWGIVNNYFGILIASLSMIMLICSYYFLQISISVMIGIPCIAMTILAIYLLIIYQKTQKNIYLIISGLLIAISLQIKLFSVFLIPLIALYLIVFAINNDQIKWQKYKMAALWSIIFLLSYIAIGIYFNVFDYDQLVQAHVATETKNVFQSNNFMKIFNTLIFNDFDLVFLGILGALVIVFTKKYSDVAYFPLVWLITTVMIFLSHKPIWYHYYILWSFPLAWLSAYAFDYLIKTISTMLGKAKPLFVKVTIIIVVSALALSLLSFQYLKIHYFIAKLHKEKDGYRNRHEILALLKQNHQHNDYIFTDRPIYAFYTNLLIPPELAVFSKKRLISGNLTDQQMIAYLEKYQPEQIFISRFREDLKSNLILQNYLKDKYLLIYDKDEIYDSPDDQDKPKIGDSLYRRKNY